MTVQPEKCRKCGKPLVGARNGKRRRTKVAHYGRGLHCRCYYQAQREGVLSQYPPLSKSREWVVRTFKELRELEPARDTQSLCINLAPRMGMTYYALQRAIYRARKDGVDV